MNAGVSFFHKRLPHGLRRGRCRDSPCFRRQFSVTFRTALMHGPQNRQQTIKMPPPMRCLQVISAQGDVDERAEELLAMVRLAAGGPWGLARLGVIGDDLVFSRVPV